ncbi:MAG: ATP-binding protein [Gammaproteobacteria bacterium]
MNRASRPLTGLRPVFGLLLLFCVGIAWFDWAQLRSIETGLRMAQEHQETAFRHLDRMDGAINTRGLLLWRIASEREPTLREQLKAEFLDEGERFNEAHQAFTQLSDDDAHPELMNRLRAGFVTLDNSMRAVLDSATEGGMEFARVALLNIGDAPQSNLQGLIAELQRLEIERISSAILEAAEASQATRQLTAAFAGSALILGLILAVLAISAQGRIHATLERARRAALNSAEARSRFLANMSHEIRTPLNAIIGMIDVMQARHNDPSLQDELRMLQTSGGALATLLDDVLDLSKVDSGRMELGSEPFSLREVVHEALELRAATAYVKGVELCASVEQAIPDVLIGDRARLRQILINLVGNAVKFTDRGEIGVRVKAEPLYDGSHWRVRFEVWDTGKGISPDKQEHLFEPFVQEDRNTSQRYGGTGLGLTISRQLVELMGGQIGVESRPGTGSRFHFEVVLRRKSRQPVEAPPPILRALNITKIFVFVPNATNRQALVQRLTQWGLPFEPCVHAQSLVRALSEHRDAIGIGDAGPSQQSAQALLTAFADRTEPALRCILLTGPGQITDEDLATFGGHALKPVAPAGLSAALAQLLVPSADEEAKEAESRLKAAARGHNVLVVEDSDVNARVTLAMLEQMGIYADHAETGEDALRASLDKVYDLILMDVHLPGIDGMETTRKILQRPGHRPVIVALTASLLPGDRDRFKEMGVTLSLSKPVRLEALREVVRTLPEGHAPALEDHHQRTQAPASGKLPDPVPGANETPATTDTPTASPPVTAELLNVFRTESRARMDSLHSALDSGDLEAAGRHAHTLKSISRTVGAHAFAELMASMEALAGDGDLEAMRQTASGVEPIYTEALAALGGPHSLNATGAA